MATSVIVIASTQIGTVGDYLYQERVRSDRLMMEKLSLQAGVLMDENGVTDAETLLSRMRETGEDLEAERILLLSDTGKVLLDTAEKAETGTAFVCDEAESVLRGGQEADYGVHDAITGEKQETTRLVYFFRSTESWKNYYAVCVKDSEKKETRGALVLVSDVSAMMRSLYSLQKQMILIFAVITAAVLIFSLIFSHIITKPIQTLTGGIHEMAKGDFSARVAENGSGELKQLAQAFNSMSEQLEQLDMSRNQFVSNASHELKTPLATMKIMIESLIYQPDMEKELRTEFLTDIDREIDRLSAIVSDLLTLVRMDSGIVKLTRESMSLAALVKETEHRLLPIAEKRGQKITLSLTDPCDMYADKGKLTQVVYNLMENAVKYTQEGGEIRVTLQKTGRDARLTVSDNGPGIAKDDLPYIFDRFYRVDKARSRESGGTGLGLSIVHQLIVLHSGSIRVESEPGKGTSFIAELPLHQG